jgi:hypothetical protein
MLLAFGWRNLVGWFLIGLGVAMVIAGIGMFERVPGLEPSDKAWGLIVAGAGAVVVGWGVLEDRPLPDCDGDYRTWDPFC